MLLSGGLQGRERSFPPDQFVTILGLIRWGDVKAHEAY